MQTIGEVSKRTGIKIPTIRFYEQEKLLAGLARTESGRRLYSEADVNRLTFVRHARSLGFELDDIRSLLDLSDHPGPSCAGVTQIARAHLAEVEDRIAQLKALQSELARIIRSCAGGAVAECRIIEALAERAKAASKPPQRAARVAKTSSS